MSAGNADARAHGPASRSAKASSTGPASGTYANTGVHVGDVNLRTGAPVVTYYSQQVANIAPRQLVGREAELAELAEFARSPEAAGHYRWWRAGPWAGKSALMSWFVLHPPRGVRVVSFFVTARLAGQDDRSAFVDNLMEQLLAMLGREAPPALPPTTRESHLLGLLDEAAGLCRDRGETLLLVVDGLDEDRGVTGSPYPHSVAGLLPVRLPDGMRVVVTGRPDPPLPVDVRPDHPLRDPAAVRVLEVFADADLVREEMENELQGLVEGTAVERDLLGLLTAAGGGLTAADLAALVEPADFTEWQVRRHLRAVAGRSFSRRDSALAPGTLPEVYVLGHDQLRATAADMLGHRRLTDYRTRLDSWADAHRHAGWPPDAPEYLLRGYHTMLLDGTPSDAALARATALCTDAARHDRLLTLTGGDTAALAQITATFDRHLARTPPDLAALGRLALHRDHLTGRNISIPPEVPSLWVRCGRPRHAIALALSLSSHYLQARALAAVGAALVRAGHRDEAVEVFDRAVEATRLDTVMGKYVTRELAEVMAEVGLPDAALPVALSVLDGFARHEALIAVVEAMVADGRYAEAVRAAGRFREGLDDGGFDRYHDYVATATALALARAGQTDQALEMASSLTDEYRWCSALVELGTTLVSAGHHDHAIALSRDVGDEHARNRVVVAVAGALAQAGRHAEAIEVAGWATNHSEHVEAVAAVAGVLVRAGRTDLVTDLADSVANPLGRGQVSVSIAAALAARGAVDEAAEVFDRAMPPHWRTIIAGWANWALKPLVVALARLGRQADLTWLVDRVTAEHRSSRWLGAFRLGSLGDALVEAEQHDRAVELAGHITAPHVRAQLEESAIAGLVAAGRHDRAFEVADGTAAGVLRKPWTALIGALVAIGRHDLAVEPFRSAVDRMEWHDAVKAMSGGRIDPECHDHALASTHHIPEHHLRNEVTAELAAAAARSGLLDRAVSTARSVTKPHARSRALAAVAEALTDAGLHDQATAVLEEAVASGQADGEVHRYGPALTAVTDALVGAGRHDRATALLTRGSVTAEGIGAPVQRVEALAVVAGALVRAGRRDQAVTVADRAAALAGDITDFSSYDRAAEAAVRALVGVDLHDRAASTARTVTDPGRRAQAWVVVVRAAVRAGLPGRVARALDGVKSALDHAAEADRQQSVPRFRRRDHVAATVVEAFAAAGRPGRAVEVAGSVTDPAVRDRTWAAVVTALTGARLHDQVTKVIGTIEDANLLTRAWLAVAGTRAHPEGLRALRSAEAAAGTAAEVHDRVDALTAVARALVDHGRRDEAARVLGRVAAEVGSITGTHRRARALGAAAEALVRAGDREGAIPLLISALRTGHWVDALPGLCAVSVGTAADLFLEYDTLVRPSPPAPVNPVTA